MKLYKTIVALTGRCETLWIKGSNSRRYLYIVCNLHMCPYMHVAICTASQLHMNVFFRSGTTDSVSYSGGHNMLPDCQTGSTRV